MFVSLTDFIGQYKLARATADDPILQSYIDREETITLYKLLGKELADLTISYNALTKTTTTSGSLVIGTSYFINSFVAGDDFINVGATSNATGVYFVATGTTPTTWTNSSSLINNRVERYDNIINPFYLESTGLYCGAPYYDSKGIKDLLTIQVYYSYLSETQARHTSSGVVNQTGENSTVMNPQNATRLGEQKWNAAGLDTYGAIQWYCRIKYPEIYPEYKGVKERARFSAFL